MADNTKDNLSQNNTAINARVGVGRGGGWGSCGECGNLTTLWRIICQMRTNLGKKTLGALWDPEKNGSNAYVFLTSPRPPCFTKKGSMTTGQTITLCSVHVGEIRQTDQTCKGS